MLAWLINPAVKPAEKLRDISPAGPTHAEMRLRHEQRKANELRRQMEIKSWYQNWR